MTVFGYLYYPLAQALFFYQTKIPATKPAYVENLKEELNYDGFYLEIPEIFAVSRILANVSVLNKQEYLPVLADNIVAHAKGSNLPGAGEGKMIYLFAHSTQQNISLVRKNAIFYLLGKLNPGSKITVHFSGKKYVYEVYDSLVVEKDEVSYLDYKTDGEESLLLQTCWPLGTSWKRLIVFARLISVI